MDGRTRISFVSKIWLGVFAAWLALLSGLFAFGLGEGTPGLLQAARLTSLLNAKTAELSRAQSQLDRLVTEAVALEKSRITQYREIRRSLGYTAPDEIVFDFGTPDTLGLN